MMFCVAACCQSSCSANSNDVNAQCTVQYIELVTPLKMWTSQTLSGSGRPCDPGGDDRRDSGPRKLCGSCTFTFISVIVLLIAIRIGLADERRKSAQRHAARIMRRILLDGPLATATGPPRQLSARLLDVPVSNRHRRRNSRPNSVAATKFGLISKDEAR